MSGGWREISVVCRKELLDGARDRRSIMSALIAPLLWPLMIVLIFNTLAGQRRKSENLKVPIVGASGAPALVDWLRQQQGIEIEEGPENPLEAVREGRADFVVVIPDGFADDFAQARPAEVRLVIDRSERDARASVARIERLIEQYSRQVAVLRLIAHGVSPSVVRPIESKHIEVSSSQKRAAMVLTFIPMFLVLAAFIGSMQIAIDATAGERERGSLEQLLINPVERLWIVAGKWLACVAFSLASVALTFTTLWLALRQVSFEQLGLRFQMGTPEVLGLLCAVAPTAFLSSSLQMYVATFARSFKEAQTYVSLLLFLPMTPAMLATFSVLEPAPWMYPIPLLGQHVLLTDVLAREVGSAVPFLTAFVSGLAASLAVVVLTARLFRREKIIFGR